MKNLLLLVILSVVFPVLGSGLEQEIEQMVKNIGSFRLEFASSGYIENMVLHQKKTYMVCSLFAGMLGALGGGVPAYFYTKSNNVGKFSMNELDKKVFISSAGGALAVLIGCFCYKKKVDDFQFYLEVGKTFITEMKEYFNRNVVRRIAEYQYSSAKEFLLKVHDMNVSEKREAMISFLSNHKSDYEDFKDRCIEKNPEYKGKFEKDHILNVFGKCFNN